MEYDALPTAPGGSSRKGGQGGSSLGERLARLAVLVALLYAWNLVGELNPQHNRMTSTLLTLACAVGGVLVAVAGGSAPRKRGLTAFALCLAVTAVAAWALVGALDTMASMNLYWMGPARPTPFHDVYFDAHAGVQSCAHFGWAPHVAKEQDQQHDPPRRRVVAAMILSLEMDVIEARIKRTASAVDQFLVYEYYETMDDKPKPQMWDASRFDSALLAKIKYVWDTDPVGFDVRFWFHTAPSIRLDNIRQRALVYSGVRTGDVFLANDGDEFLHPSVLELLARCDGWGPVVAVKATMMVYGFDNCKGDSLNILGAVEYDEAHDARDQTIAIRYHGAHWGEVGKHRVRLNRDNSTESWVGMHCSWCYKCKERILYKMRTYTHQDQFAKITVDRAFVDRAIASGRVLESYWAKPEPTHATRGGRLAKSDPLWKSGLLSKEMRWCDGDGKKQQQQQPPP
jgi:hypothetical protein